MAEADLQSLPRGSRVLLVLADLIGDTLFRTPAVGLLSRHYPGLRFDALVFSGAAASIFRHNEGVERVHVLRRGGAVRALIESYDLVINLRQTNIRKYLRGLATPCLSYRKGARGIHKAADLLNYAGSLLPEGAAIEEADRPYRFPIGQAERRRVDALLAEEGVAPERETLVALHPGCASMAAYRLFFAAQSLVRHPKAWPVARHGELARRLSEGRSGVRCLAVGSGKEAFLARRVVRGVPGAVNLAGRLNLVELAALMDRLSCFVCHDTGTLHIACARRTPIVALLGPTRPERTGPYPDLPRFRVLRGRRTQDISVEEAERAVLRKLEEPDGEETAPSRITETAGHTERKGQHLA